MMCRTTSGFKNRAILRTQRILQVMIFVQYCLAPVTLTTWLAALAALLDMNGF